MVGLSAAGRKEFHRFAAIVVSSSGQADDATVFLHSLFPHRSDRLWKVGVGSVAPGSVLLPEGRGGDFHDFLEALGLAFGSVLLMLLLLVLGLLLLLLLLLALFLAALSSSFWVFGRGRLSGTLSLSVIVLGASVGRRHFGLARVGP